MSDGLSAISGDPAATDPSRAGAPAPAGAIQAPKPPSLAKPAKGATGDSLTLSPEAKAQVAKLQARDADVKAHEQAHMAAGAGLVTSGASYTYQRGPDGQMYAIGGEVGIDTSPVKGNPSATLAKAMRIEAAALAPADPSGQDQAVAAQAAAMAAQASAEAAAQGVGGSQGKPAAAASGKAASGAQAVGYGAARNQTGTRFNALG